MKLYSLFYVISRRVWRWILQDSKCKSRGIDIVCVRSLGCQARNGLVWASLLVGWIWPSPLAMLESRFGLSQSCIAPICSAPMIEREKWFSRFPWELLLHWHEFGWRRVYYKSMWLASFGSRSTEDRSGPCPEDVDWTSRPPEDGLGKRLGDNSKDMW